MENKFRDNQQVFRKLLDSFSYPGKIVKIEKFKEYNTDLINATFEILLMLLDTEVSFYLDNNKENDIKEIELWTLSRLKNIEEADFLVVSLDSEENLENIIKNAKRGSLINPHSSATIIIETEEIKENGNLNLSGPGIKDSRSISISGYEKWINLRDEVISEFPMGVDFIIVSKDNNIISLPRTTEISEGEI